MNDDRIQGILFSQSLYLDLAQHGRYEQYLMKLRTTSQNVRATRIRVRTLLHEASPYTVHKLRRAERARTAFVSDLLGRMHVPGQRRD